MNDRNLIAVATKSALVTVVFAGALMAAPRADAAIRMNIQAPAACKSASGYGANAFYYDSQYVQNTSTTTQYLTCSIPEINPGTNRAATDIQFILRNTGTATATFTCVVQAGYSVGGVNNAVITVDIAAGGASAPNINGSSTPVMPARASQYAPYTMSCALPAGGRLDIITVGFPETIA